MSEALALVDLLVLVGAAAYIGARFALHLQPLWVYPIGGPVLLTGLSKFPAAWAVTGEAHYFVMMTQGSDPLDGDHASCMAGQVSS